MLTQRLAGEVNYPLITALKKMEDNGLHFCMSTYDKIKTECMRDYEDTLVKFYYQFGVDFVDSQKSFDNIFKESDFNTIVERTKGGGISYTKDQFLQLKNVEHKGMLMTLKDCSYFLSMYGKKFLSMRVGGVFRPSFYETKTQRLGTSKPCLSNLPSATAYDIKKCFITHKKGYVFLNLDYVSQELRLQADLSGDKGLINVMNKGLDMHTYTQKLGGFADRRKAKNYNFAKSYGAGNGLLAKMLGVSISEVVSINKKLDQKMRGVASYRDTLQSFSKRFKYIINGMGSVVACDMPYRALNYSIQSTASDIMRAVLVRINMELEDLFKTQDCKMVMQVYDSIIFSLPLESVGLVSKQVSDIMISSYKPKNGLSMSVDSKVYKGSMSEQDVIN